MDDNHKLTKKEKKELRKMEWQEKAVKEKRNAKIKKFSIWGGVILAFLVVGFVLLQVVTAPAQPTQAVNIAPVSARDLSEGNPKAKVILIEYADFQCPACAAYHLIVNQIISNYGNKLFYVYRMFPLSSVHQNAIISAQAAYAAYKQKAFFAYDDMLFSKQAEWADLQDPKTALVDYATLLKLDTTKFKADMLSSQAQKYVQDSEAEATSEGINQTPTFFINGNVIQNPTDYNAFKQLIDATLNKK